MHTDVSLASRRLVAVEPPGIEPCVSEPPDAVKVLELEPPLDDDVQAESPSPVGRRSGCLNGLDTHQRSQRVPIGIRIDMDEATLGGEPGCQRSFQPGQNTQLGVIKTDRAGNLPMFFKKLPPVLIVEYRQVSLTIRPDN